jgi:pimeloyl-ACP methyl ester carboxylesterase
LYKHRQLQALPLSPPRLPPGRPREIFKRVVEVVHDIQAGGRSVGLSGVCSPAILTPKPSQADFAGLATPLGSSSDLQNRPLHRDGESNVEQLLREWDSLERSVPAESARNAEFMEKVFSAAERAAVERRATELEIIALKRAEVSGWFLERSSQRRWPAHRLGEIGQDNMAEFIAWAFFHCDPKNVPESRRKEFEELMTIGYEWVDVQFPAGYNPDVKCMRLTMDNIQAAHRPLLYYGLTAIVLPMVTERLLSARGFTRHKSGSLAYWHRPSTASMADERVALEPPFVFCHGIGPNVLPYLLFIDDMLNHSSRRDMFLVSLPHISWRIKEDVPSSGEMVACLSDMLASWGHESAHFIGHSFGSVPVAWMVRRAPEMVKMATFMDPVVFLLVKPDVCYNFIYRKASTPTRLIMEYFAARELYTAHSMSRNFFWFENMLWPEQLTMPSLIVLSGKDTIVPAHSVRRYMAAFIQQHAMETLSVLWFADHTHGQLIGPGGAPHRKRVLEAMIAREAGASCSSHGQC